MTYQYTASHFESPPTSQNPPAIRSTSAAHEAWGILEVRSTIIDCLSKKEQMSLLALSKDNANTVIRSLWRTMKAEEHQEICDDPNVPKVRYPLTSHSVKCTYDRYRQEYCYTLKLSDTLLWETATVFGTPIPSYLHS
jgi:hypothetical protein